MLRTNGQPPGTAAEPAARGAWGEAFYRLGRHPVGMTGLVLMLLIVMLAVAGPRFFPYSYADTDLAHSYGRPSARHPCGTDNLGRDECVRLLYGARISLAVGLVSALISLLVGVLYGAVSGYYGGTVDLVLQRIVELLDAVPQLLYLILLLTVVRPGLGNILLVLGATGWLGMARVVRGEVLALREQDYVQAAQALGAPPRRLIWRHLVPGAAGPILVTLTVGIPAAIFFESFLSFIGLGVSSPLASWGTMTADALAGLRSHPLLLFAPAAAIGLTLLAFQFLGQGLQDALDPRGRRT